jgi:hypothetical protein
VDERIWALPGPRTLITETMGEIKRRRHVSIVLPQRMCDDATFTDGLAVSLIEEANRTAYTRRVFADGEARSLLEVISRAIVFDDPPATVPELLRHPEATDTVAVVVAADLPESQQAEFPKLLQRVDQETRPGPGEARLSLIVIGGHQHLPHFAGGETSDVSLAAVWWWNRIARWDAGAYISRIDPIASDPRILADIRAETIVEVARWDLSLAEHLAQCWSGDTHELSDHLENSDSGGESAEEINEDCGPRPREAALKRWNAGLLDGWHDIHSVSALTLSTSPHRLQRLVWAAQARIVLPWIEQRREVLQRKVVERLGRKPFNAVLQTLFDPPLTDTGLVEIGPLKRIIEIRVGGADPQLRSAARRLYHARNELAHLRSLNLAELRELVAACRDLD